LISETIWRSPQTLAGSRSIAAAIRVDMVASTGRLIRAVEEYGLIQFRAKGLSTPRRVPGLRGAASRDDRVASSSTVGRREAGTS
jgi:hypothetical protein